MVFLYGKWTSLPLPTRHEIARVLGIPKRGPTHVDSNVIVSDGYAIAEVENALSVSNLQAYTNSDSEDLVVLWDLMLAKAEGREEPTKTVIVEPTPELKKEPKKKSKKK